MSGVPINFVEADFLHNFDRKLFPKGSLPAGTARWEGPFEFGEYVLSFMCPCGCDESDFVIAAPKGAAEGRRSWLWDGNKEKPTLAPSILRTGAPCKWHGFLRAGVWEKA